MLKVGSDRQQNAFRIDFAGNRARTVGDAWMDKADYSKSIEEYKEACRLIPSDSASPEALARLYMLVEDYTSGISAYKDALANGASALADLANAYHRNSN